MLREPLPSPVLGAAAALLLLVGSGGPAFAGQDVISERGEDFDEDTRYTIRLGETRGKELRRELGQSARKETVDGVEWLIFEFETLRWTQEERGDSLRLVDFRSSGKRLRIRLGSSKRPAVAEWVFESWTPDSRTQESSTYWLTHGGAGAAMARAERLAKEEDEAKAKEDPAVRAQAILDTVAQLDAAGVDDAQVRRRLIDGALRQAGFGPITDEEYASVAPEEG